MAARYEPKMTRARDFAETGNYRVRIGDKVFLIYRNNQATTGPWNKGDWLVADRHVPQRVHEAQIHEYLGHTKEEALEQLQAISHMLKNPLRVR